MLSTIFSGATTASGTGAGSGSTDATGIASTTAAALSLETFFPPDNSLITSFIFF